VNGAEVLWRTLVEAGVDTCFTNPGTTEMDMVRAFDSLQGLRAVLCLFEGVATGAADGYGRIAGKPAVSLLHVAPGLTNGLANLHNARRAHTPLINIVGDYPSWHRDCEALLSADLLALATPMSNWVRESLDVATLSADAAATYAATAGGRVASLIVASDAAWDEAEGAIAKVPPVAALSPADSAIDAAAKLLRARPGVALLVGGNGLNEKGLAAANRIAAVTECRVLADTFAARIERGAGRGRFGPLPGLQPAAIELLQKAGAVVLAGMDPPVANIAYRGYPGLLIPEACDVVQVATPHENSELALELLADALNATEAGVSYGDDMPEAPSGELTARAIGAAIARAIPEGAIVSAEPTTAGGPIFGATRSAPPHIWLGLTGGAIGQGMPLAVGAGVAAPDAKIICIQADGGGMYTVQALWTMARENLNITTVILKNNRYRILEREYQRDGANEVGAAAARLFQLDDPAIGWCELARGMGVEATVADSAEVLTAALSDASRQTGPRLIEALMVD
jgi:acetolactate synthase-1/2/3 large subunit